MNKYLGIALILLGLSMPAGARGRVGGGVTNVRNVIQKGTFTLTGPWTFDNGVIFLSTPTFVAGSTVATTAPITGNGGLGNPLGVDPSSVTLHGNLINVPNGLVELNGANKLPNVDGSLLTNIAAGDVVLQARNKTGSLIPLGSVVYVDGAQGNTPTIQLAQANDHDTSHAIGVASEDIANNATGAVLQFGFVDGVNTSGFSEGDQLYLSTSVAGGVTAIEPPASEHKVHIGIIAKSDMTNGSFIALIHADHPQTGGVDGLTQAVKTSAELQAESCPGYPGTRCQFYSSTDDRLYTSTGSLVGQWRAVGTNTGP